MNSDTVIRNLKKLSRNTSHLSGAVVYAYAKASGVEAHLSDILDDYDDSLDRELCEAVNTYFSEQKREISFPFLVELLEILVPETDRKETGVAYTPEIIKDYILDECILDDSIPTVLDPSCGCGSFLVSIAERLHMKYGISYCECISEFVYGADVDPEAIKKAKLLLSLLAIKNKESVPQRFNLILADMLNPRSVESVRALSSNGFDCVVGNPPYVRSRNIVEEEKEYLSCWESSSVGNVDLYMPFFEIGLTLLRRTGRLGYITANGFLQGVNGRALRKYLLSQECQIRITDFRDAQLFKNVTSYTCVTVIEKTKHSERIFYSRINEENSLSDHIYSEYAVESFANGAPWRMRKSSIDLVIDRLENAGTPLSNWKIRNGLATLKNDLFFFEPSGEDSQYYYRSYKGRDFAIEKGICIPIAKPNTIKTELDLSNNSEVAIFPYERKNGSICVMDEAHLKIQFPKTLDFLSAHRDILEARDKGHGDYPAWYAYGRTQGMNNFGKKLLIPYIADEPTAVLSLDESLLFYCGYALFSDSEEELRVIKAFLKSDAFWYYIFHTSKPYSKGYMALAKNYIVHFSIPELSEEEKAYILSTPPRSELNDFIWRKYNIDTAIFNQ